MIISTGRKKASCKGDIGKRRELVVPWKLLQRRYLWLLDLLYKADGGREEVRTNVSNSFKHVPFVVTGVTPFLSLCLNVYTVQDQATTFLSFSLEVLSAAQTVVPEKQCNEDISLCKPYTWGKPSQALCRRCLTPGSCVVSSLCPHFPSVGSLTQGVWVYSCSQLLCLA